MSGHSKWANIKHKKGKSDAARGAIFTKIGREIAVAVKAGGADPASNSRLRDVIAKAKASNMPNDNITRSIKKASGELSSVNYEEMIYEGYGTSGVAVIVEALTDNKNRTAGDVRHCFDKYGGSMGMTGCVSFMFDRKGVFVIEKDGKVDFDTLMDYAIEAGADDVTDEEDVFEILTAPESYSEVRDYLEEKGVSFLSSGIERIPQNTVELPEDKIETFQKMVEKLEELDDVQNIYHNASNADEEEDED